jgi:hypothetical protein
MLFEAQTLLRAIGALADARRVEDLASRGIAAA